MGIEKLKGYLREMRITPAWSLLPAHSHLCIDGYGFMFFILKDLLSDQEFCPELGGCYDRLDACIKEYIT